MTYCHNKQQKLTYYNCNSFSRKWTEGQERCERFKKVYVEVRNSDCGDRGEMP